jgi:hypothetical protein
LFSYLLHIIHMFVVFICDIVFICLLFSYLLHIIHMFVVFICDILFICLLFTTGSLKQTYQVLYNSAVSDG